MNYPCINVRQTGEWEDVHWQMGIGRQMEGAGWGKALLKVFLPHCLSASAITAIFSFTNVWNELAVTLTMPRRQESYSLPVQVVSLVARCRMVE